jgi:hypothetical protein
VAKGPVKRLLDLAAKEFPEVAETLGLAVPRRTKTADAPTLAVKPDVVEPLAVRPQTVNPIPETNLSIRDQAEQFSNRLRALGVKVGDIQHSVNRNGQNSAYLSTEHGQLRISDHDVNMDFRPGQIAIYDTSESGAQRFVERAQRAKTEGAARRASAAEIQAAHEEPFIQRFLSAPEHKRHSIILEAYPELSGPHYKQKRMELLRRWRSRDRQHGG